jgi:hypothetical protein
MEDSYTGRYLAPMLARGAARARRRA